MSQHEGNFYTTSIRNIQMKHNMLLVIIMLMVSSCQPIMMKFYGIKKPDIENEKTITQKAKKFGLQSSNIVSVCSESFLQTLNGQSIPDASIYDHNGRYIEYRSTDSTCNAGLFAFIPNLRKDVSYNQPDSTDLQTELLQLRDLKGNVLPKPQQADFYLMIYWSVWTGKLNKDHVKIWEDLAIANTNCKIEVILVNLDIQEYWEPTKRYEIKKALRKA
jgi:hypothetical protein